MNKIHDYPGPHLPGWTFIPASAADAATAIVAAWRAPYKLLITGFNLVATAAVTGTDTESRNINIQKAEQGEAADEVAHIDLESGTDLVVGVNAVDFNSGDSLAMNEGDLILVESQLVGTTGLATPNIVLEIQYEGA